MSNMYSQLLEAGLAAGIPMINTDTSARILAVVFVYQFKITKEGKKSWSIEVGYHERPGCVLYWMPLPIPLDFGHFEVEPSNWRVKHKIWVENGILGREATQDEVHAGKAEWCWECGNPSCLLSKRDNLAMCQHFQKRSAEDMESDPHFGGH